MNDKEKAEKVLELINSFEIRNGALRRLNERQKTRLGLLKEIELVKDIKKIFDYDKFLKRKIKNA